jgi:hypothetical protein
MSQGWERTTRWLRWAGILPAAVLAGFSIEAVARIVFRAIAAASGEPAQTILVSCLRLFLLYVPKETGFVVVGATVAPRGKCTTAVLLAALRLLLSLATHLLTQTRWGSANYWHLALESTGALLGAGHVALTSRRRRRKLSGDGMRRPFLQP